MKLNSDSYGALRYRIPHTSPNSDRTLHIPKSDRTLTPICGF
ncbi:hypothetical protein PN480_04800 [Dolichospermum circinale CS-1225]|nr:hypothetical protein [Dolichospermum circinale]MDB9521274.1 hypothetical protein [Dolichospermum circinale CS-1225]